MTNKQIEKKDLPAGRQVEFKSGKNTLRGSLFVPRVKGPFPAVIFFHGSGSRGQKYFDAGNFLSKKGFLCLAFNFSGCGVSDGVYKKQTHEDAFKDGKSAFNFLLTQENIDKNRIGLVGGSFGGFVVSMILPEVEVKSLVLLSASAHDDSYNTKIDMGSLENEVKYFKNEFNWINSEAYKNISDYRKSLLVIKSENDENVPENVVDRYFDVAKKASRKELKVIKGADHRLSTEKMRNEFYKIISDWFLKTL